MLSVRLYNRDGGFENVNICNVYKYDEEWFKKHNIIVSLEPDSSSDDNYFVYGKWGDEDHQESIQLSRGRSCEDTLQALRDGIVKMMKEYHKTF